MTDKNLKIRLDLIADFQTQIDEMQWALDRSAIVASHGHIVLDRFQTALTFNTVAHGKKFFATVSGQGLPHKVNRFEKKDAQTLADLVEGTAIHWTDATRAYINRLNESITILKTYQ